MDTQTNPHEDLFLHTYFFDNLVNMSAENGFRGFSILSKIAGKRHDKLRKLGLSEEYKEWCRDNRDDLGKYFSGDFLKLDKTVSNT